MINVILDYDGTLHDSSKIYVPAFKKAYKYLVDNNKAPQKEWNHSEIVSWLGFSAKDMWDNFMPDLAQEDKDYCSKMIGESMLESIEDNKAQLYDGSLITLKKLKNEGFRLIFLSNCKVDYMNVHIKYFNLDEYFDDFYCTEQYNFEPKYKIFEDIKQKYDGEFIVIGDRFQDIEIAQKHNLKSIGCLYGFGSDDELTTCDYLADDVEDIYKYLMREKSL